LLVIVETLLESAGRFPSRNAVTDPTRTLTFADLARFSDVMRRQVEKATSAPHVGILMPSTCAFAGTFFGTLWAGRTVVPLNFLLQPAELAAVVRDAELDVVFAIKYFRELAEALPVKVIYIEDLPLKREMILQRVRSHPPAPSVAPDDTAVLLYTSGTSGKPKGVCQTYGNLKAQLKTEHTFLGVLPLFHSFGLTAMLLIPVRLGAPVIYIPRFQPNAVIDAIREQRASVTIMIASMYTAMLRTKKGGPDDFKSIEFAISGGEALAPQTFEQFRERFGVEILQGYGMSEAAPVVSLNAPWAHKRGSVGQAIPGVTVAAHSDDGRLLPPGEVGELWVTGPIVMKGYYKKPEETSAVLTPDGWYKSGDMGHVDAEGYITITGRKKEMIIVGGENVYPREIEVALEEHPAVNESAAIGQMDPSRGEVVVAFVTLHEGATVDEIALREHCRQHLAGYKVPRKIIISTDLPRGPTGKILKRKLAELLTPASGDAAS
jgi:long-chain acyl-CoA synthetase